MNTLDKVAHILYNDFYKGAWSKWANSTWNEKLICSWVSGRKIRNGSLLSWVGTKNWHLPSLAGAFSILKRKGIQPLRINIYQINHNRAIRDADTGDIADIIAGTFFICDCSGESFGSLFTEQQKRYLEKYRLPERFFRSRDGIESVPYKPQHRER